MITIEIDKTEFRTLFGRINKISQGFTNIVGFS